MEENAVINLIAMETAEPKRKLNRSAGAIYVVLIALILGVITLANLLYARWQIPRYVLQPAFYAAIAVYGVIVYQRNYISFRYTLTDRMLAIERIAGNQEMVLLVVSLRGIHTISSYQQRPTGKRRSVNASKLARLKSIVVILKESGREISCRISPSDDFLQKLTAQWLLAKAQKE